MDKTDEFTKRDFVQPFGVAADCDFGKIKNLFGLVGVVWPVFVDVLFGNYRAFGVLV